VSEQAQTSRPPELEVPDPTAWRIPFNRPHVIGTESGYIREAVERGQLSGNGLFARRCAQLLEETVGSRLALLTPSCTAALEMAAILADVGPGDEVIMPSFAFVSAANAVALRGGVPVFVDIREDTCNIDERLVEDAVTERTKAVTVIHYGGVGCDLDVIGDVAERHGLVLVEDAAHAVGARWRGRPLGGVGELGTLSFHETKNVHCGEGGALLVNDERFAERAEILQEKGTDRSRFFRGEIDKYTWQDLGSSFLLSDLGAAFLWAQLERTDEINAGRQRTWDAYHSAFEGLERDGRVRRPVIPEDCEPNASLYYLLVRDLEERTAVVAALAERSIYAAFHYVPLHSSPGGSRLGRVAGELAVTDAVSDRLVRLPLWAGMPDRDVARVVDAVHAFYAAA